MAYQCCIVPHCSPAAAGTTTTHGRELAPAPHPRRDGSNSTIPHLSTPIRPNLSSPPLLSHRLVASAFRGRDSSPPIRLRLRLRLRLRHRKRRLLFVSPPVSASESPPPSGVAQIDSVAWAGRGRAPHGPVASDISLSAHRPAERKKGVILLTPRHRLGSRGGRAVACAGRRGKQGLG
ncbi:hypothetical protein GUJ93_ZPchr0006g41207 [Zizania palustris]|uniref:Uncharacterized protein n=1 Tax=Zizania palustris TaxID=103762 RepID=A0A8J5SIF4_ZIZPA|nr:hypothetical protein GUJ93_ZPchr0006g41207 [Zizania palustris]